MNEEQLKEWNKLKLHCQEFKENKGLNSSRPLEKKEYQPEQKIPYWKRLKEYEPKLERWVKVEELLSGKINRISVMG